VRIRQYPAQEEKIVTHTERVRTGGELVIESFVALGAEAIFGEPGQHALPMWDGLRKSEVEYVGLRTELNVAFAADGYARVTGKPAPVLLSTGPGALISLAALMEAANSAVPMVAVLAQIPSAGLGARRRGYVHELHDQIASFTPVVKKTISVRHAETIPDVVAHAYRLAHSAPHGPVVIEIPVDQLFKEVTDSGALELDSAPVPGPAVRPDILRSVGAIIDAADSVVMVAGGGLVRSGAFEAFADLAHTLRANVVSTHTGRGAFPEDDPLFAGATGDDAAVNDLIGSADVVLCFGSKLGEETSGHFTLKIAGSLVQIDPEPLNISTNYPAIPIVADAGVALVALLGAVRKKPADGAAERRAAQAHERVTRDLGRQDREEERAMLAAIRAAWPPEGITSWDMTILGYWSTQYFPVPRPRTYLYPHGSGSLGYAIPAAIGAAVAQPDISVLAVVGDGGSMYGLSEFATAKQHELPVRFLIVNNHRYGVLHEYQMADFGKPSGVDLFQPDFVKLIEAFDIPVRASTPATLEDDLRWADTQSGPAVVVLAASPQMFRPTS
jgi:acetolactate synthase-1/2/3 large subunit